MSRASVWTISAIGYAPHVSQTQDTNTVGQFYIVPIGWFPVEERATGIEKARHGGDRTRIFRPSFLICTTLSNQDGLYPDALLKMLHAHRTIVQPTM